MDSGFAQVLREFGETVTLRKTGGAEEKALALVRPLLDRGEEQDGPSPLGLRRRGRLLCLGQAGVALEAYIGRAAYYRGARYRVRQAKPIYMGGTLSHWWAVLEEDDG